MRERLIKLQQWVNTRSLRERIFILLTGLVFLYMVLYFFLFRPMDKEISSINSKIAAQKMELATTNQEIQMMLGALANPEMVKLQKEKLFITVKTTQVQQQLQQVIPNITPDDAIPVLTKTILAIQDNKVKLIQLKSGDRVIWNAPEIEKVLQNQVVYIQPMEVAFEGTFFTTLQYLKLLEGLPWHIYWDELNYKVLKYPLAEVTVKFHVLTNKKAS